jgi:hypothetical protein
MANEIEIKFGNYFDDIIRISLPYLKKVFKLASSGGHLWQIHH